MDLSAPSAPTHETPQHSCLPGLRPAGSTFPLWVGLVALRSICLIRKPLLLICKQTWGYGGRQVGPWNN